MGKLNIAHHKSYHPYRRDNIEKVRRDEEEARLQEAKEEGRMQLADAEARIELLRERSGSKKKKVDNDDMKALARQPTSQAELPTSGGHINFFEDLEQSAIITSTRSTKKADPVETDKGVPLAPSAKDLKPWYSQADNDQLELDQKAEERRKRDTARKSIHDPLTSITKQLASSSSSSSSSPVARRPRPAITNSSRPPESSERKRALALIRKKAREKQGSETPSTVHGGASEYGDMYNRRAVEEAHRGRRHHW
ncbi:hypothetical protein BDZ89DRAFT_1094661 [Hymenopellis radicata]|nr:hypothetical protein BDZ89DRAFT_1094661 [Hymenopellis radicata]